MTARISVLGLGAMGSRMALRPLRTGHAVTVCKRRAAATAALLAAGASAPAWGRKP